MHVDRDTLVIARATVDAVYRDVLELSGKGADITGSTQIDNSVASYIFPMFVRFGIIKGTGTVAGTGVGNSDAPGKQPMPQVPFSKASTFSRFLLRSTLRF